ncbi:MAG: Carboxypeptidase regulatory-like domain [Candidatus Eremiobacteraeota bacterium]|nr:Carboxypeptidase regulatory-like domain [Candidatus Eremiobacteraeota bacterium]
MVSGRLLADMYVVKVTFGTLHCTLLDRRSSAPLGGARVTCIWRNERVSVLNADEQGSFTAELPEGVYDLVISARGYLSLFVRGVGVLAGYRQSLIRGLIPGEGQPLDGEPSTAIAGFVRDRVGLAVPNATIHLNAENGGAAYTTRTDKEGAYVVHGVIPGSYDLAVRAGDRTLAHQHVPIAHVKTLVRTDLRIIQL